MAKQNTRGVEEESACCAATRSLWLAISRRRLIVESHAYLEAGTHGTAGSPWPPQPRPLTARRAEFSDVRGCN